MTEGESASLTTLTSPLAPTFVADQTVVDVHSVVLAWRPPANLGSPLVGYEVIASLLECHFFTMKVIWTGPSGENTGERILLVNGETMEVTDLAMGQTYSFQVKVMSFFDLEASCLPDDHRGRRK